MAQLLLDQRRSRTAGVFESLLLLGLVVGFGFVPVYLIRHPEYAGVAEIGVGVLLVPVVIVAGVILAWRLVGQEQVELDGEYLRVTRRVGPFRRSLSIGLASVLDVSTGAVGHRELQSNVFGYGHPSVIVKAGPFRIRCGVAISPEEAEEVAGRIRVAVEAARRRTRG